MSKLYKVHEENMQTVLASKGVVAKVQIAANGYKITVSSISRGAVMVLTYPDTLTPGEVCMAVAELFEKINRK